MANKNQNTTTTQNTNDDAAPVQMVDTQSADVQELQAAADEATPETVEVSMQDKIAALTQARGLMMKSGMDAEQVDLFFETQIAPLRAEADKDFMDAILAIMDPETHNWAGLQGGNQILMTNATFLIVVKTDENGNVATVDGQRYVKPTEPTKKTRKAGGNGETRERAASPADGNILVVNGEAFKSYAALTARKKITVTGASQRSVYDKATAKNAEAYPAPQFVPVDEFFKSPKDFAPKGYYIVDKDTKEAKKTQPVR